MRVKAHYKFIYSFIGIDALVACFSLFALKACLDHILCREYKCSVVNGDIHKILLDHKFIKLKGSSFLTGEPLCRSWMKVDTALHRR